MTELRCETCGNPAEATLLGSLLCLGCRARYREFHCGICGQRVMYLGEFAADHPEFAVGVCTTCHMRARVTALPPADREAIRAAAENGTLAGIRETRERLGWSITEAASLVQVLRGRSEPGAAPDPAGK